MESLTISEYPKHSIMNIRSKLVLVSGQNEHTNLDLPDYFMNLYLDSDRLKAIELLCPKLKALARGELSDQMNCFLFLGSAGVGKTQFIIALGQWFIDIQVNPSGIFIFYDSCNNSNPFNVSGNLDLMAIIHYHGREAHWPDIPDEPWSSLDDCWDWLITNNKRVLLALDEFDRLFKFSNHGGFMNQLASVGNYSGPRPIVAILCGSSSYLYKLCFQKANHSLAHFHTTYELYKTAPNFNNTKYVPVLLGPIRIMTDFRRALIAIGKEEEPSDSELIDKFNSTRGQIRYMKDSSVSQTTVYDLLTQAAGSSYSGLLKAMWLLVEDSPKLQLLSKVIHVKLCVDDLSVSIEELISKYKISDNHIHDACDSGYVRLLCDDLAVAFAHPSDIIDLARYFGKAHLFDHTCKL